MLKNYFLICSGSFAIGVALDFDLIHTSLFIYGLYAVCLSITNLEGKK